MMANLIIDVKLEMKNKNLDKIGNVSEDKNTNIEKLNLVSELKNSPIVNNLNLKIIIKMVTRFCMFDEEKVIFKKQQLAIIYIFIQESMKMEK